MWDISPARPLETACIYLIVRGNHKERFNYVEEIEKEVGRKSPRKKYIVMAAVSSFIFFLSIISFLSFFTIPDWSQPAFSGRK